jgi:DNA invertase Pin-like site-specific DNA recombinase
MAAVKEQLQQRIRCAVYTRKSSDEGLDQEYNSIDAQRDAGQAYIASQRHEGWIPVAGDYDDPAFSGGNMDRPGLKRLIADIDAKLIDVVVVYKIDRLTRSLADFSKMVEIFDAHGVSFVSVTQQFNTTSSMGRLMLNVLLSFAQFEREVTGERIRDKIGASKKKGMWMGGIPPLGYDVVERKLIVNEEEAELVRRLFSDYVRTDSLTMLMQHLRDQGVRTKTWITQDGKVRAGKLIDKGYVYKMLHNPIYYGMVRYQGECYRGEHTPIITQEAWEKAQAKLAKSNPRSLKGERKGVHTALLKGLLFSPDGRAMTPVGQGKPGTGKNYRYYRSTTDQKVKARTTGLPMLPAEEIERAVIEQVRKILRSTEIVTDVFMAIKTLNSPQTQHLDEFQTSNLMASVDKVWDALYPIEKHRIMQLLIKKVVAYPNRLDITFYPSSVANLVIEVAQKPLEEPALCT